MKTRHNLCTALLAVTTLSSLACSSASAKGPTDDATDEVKHAALFDNFIYKGNDTFYNQNPLTDDGMFYNPILPGWYSDPSICTNGEGDYFLVCSTFSYFPGVPIFHSRDLVNWTQIGHVLSRPSQLVNLQRQHMSEGIFAPDIKYNPHNKTYYMVTTNVGAGNFFVKTTDPFGEWSDPIMLPEVGGIDPSFFFDEDGRAYIVNNDDAPDGKPEYSGHRTIRVQEFDVKTDRTIGPRKILVNKGVHPEEKPIWIEGPHMYKINGKYFLMDAEGGTSTWHSEVIFRADSPMGPFTPWEKNPILTQRHLDPKRPNPVTCAGHADLLQTKEGDWWAVFLACRPIDNDFENLGRETFMMPVRWSDDGFPYMTQGNETVPLTLKRPEVKRSDKVTFGNFEETVEFDTPKLGLQWLTLRAPGTDLYSLTSNPGYLTLQCADLSAKDRCTPAFVARRMQHHQFECTTRMKFTPADNQESAGLLLFKDETHQYYLCVSQKGKVKSISLKKISAEADEVLAENILKAKQKYLELKVVSHGKCYDFYYRSACNNKWTQLCADVDAGYLSTRTAGGFTGTVIGPYATRK